MPCASARIFDDQSLIICNSQAAVWEAMKHGKCAWDRIPWLLRLETGCYQQISLLAEGRAGRACAHDLEMLAMAPSLKEGIPCH